MKNGFTLIELVVVMAVISVLFVIAISGIASAQSSQRDAGREHFAAMVNQMIDTYQNSKSALPSNANFAGYGSTYFINRSACSSGSINVAGTCIKLNGLTFTTPYIPASGSTCPTNLPGAVAMTNTQVILCWTSALQTNGQPIGTNGYQLGVYLENRSIYWIAQ